MPHFLVNIFLNITNFVAIGSVGQTFGKGFLLLKFLNYFGKFLQTSLPIKLFVQPTAHDQASTINPASLGSRAGFVEGGVQPVEGGVNSSDLPVFVNIPEPSPILDADLSSEAHMSVSESFGNFDAPFANLGDLAMSSNQ